MIDYDRYIEVDNRDDNFYCENCEYCSTNDDNLVEFEGELYCEDCYNIIIAENGVDEDEKEIIIDIPKTTKKVKFTKINIKKELPVHLL